MSSSSSVAALAALARQEENEEEEDKRPGSPISGPKTPNSRPGTPIHTLLNRAIQLTEPAGLHEPIWAPRSGNIEPSSIPAGENPFANMKQNVEREKLCIKAANMVWNDLSQVLIWPMNDINRSDKAMCERVADLLGPDLRGEEVMLGDVFLARNFKGMSIVDDRRLCGILVATDQTNIYAKVRVADIANLKPQTEKYAVGYGEFDVSSRKFFGAHVVIVKRGQQAIIEGDLPLRFFVRMVLGTESRVAKIAAKDAWNWRQGVDERGPRWHEYFTKKTE